MDDPSLSSGELARMAGVNVETLRFYEREGLLPTPERTASGHRRYGSEALNRLQLIGRGKALGFMLPEIAALIDALEDPDAVCEDVGAAVDTKLDHVDRLLAELKARRPEVAQAARRLPAYATHPSVPDHRGAGRKYGKEDATMKKLGMTALVVAPLSIGGFVYARAQRQADKREPMTAVGYTCPLTGEELPCPNCCPLNQQK